MKLEENSNCHIFYVISNFDINYFTASFNKKFSSIESSNPCRILIFFCMAVDKKNNSKKMGKNIEAKIFIYIFFFRITAYIFF